jgi:tetratricopeptide (TPR) repeat protein
MARSVGLDARYREVLGVPKWQTSGEFVMLNHHIAAYGELGKNGTYIADFGSLYAGEQNFGRVISDDRARAQHFNNLGARELVNGDIPAAVRFFARGLTIDPKLGYVWTNLGTAYLRDDELKQAEMALHEALRLTPWDITALNQLTRLYEITGRTDLATRYRHRSEAARRQNPYLEFTWALEARDAGHLDVAVGYLRNAAQTEPTEMYFWLELAKTYVMEGKRKEAQHTLRRAEALVATTEQRNAFTKAFTDMTALTSAEPETPALLH